MNSTNPIRHNKHPVPGMTRAKITASVVYHDTFMCHMHVKKPVHDQMHCGMWNVTDHDIYSVLAIGKLVSQQEAAKFTVKSFLLLVM